MRREALGDSLRVDAGLVHAQAHGGQAAAQHPAFVGLKNGAEKAARGTNPANQVGILGERDSSEHVAETGKIFCPGVEDEIRAELERMLECRAEHGVVHQNQRARAALGNFQRGDGVANLPDVRHDQCGIGRSFQHHRAEIFRGRDRAVDPIGVVRRERECPRRPTARGSPE